MATDPVIFWGCRSCKQLFSKEVNGGNCTAKGQWRNVPGAECGGILDKVEPCLVCLATGEVELSDGKKLECHRGCPKREVL